MTKKLSGLRALLLVTVCSVLFTVVSGNAATVIFNGILEEGSLFADGATTTEITDTFQYELHDTIQISYGGAFNSGGLGFYNVNKFTIPEGETILQLAMYSTHNTGISSFTVQTDAGDISFNNSNGTWTVDGDPGNTSLLTANTWHIVQLDLTSIAGLDPGTTQFDGQMALKSNAAGGTGEIVYLGEILLLSPVPEPSSAVLAAFGLIALVSTRRRG